MGDSPVQLTGGNRLDGVGENKFVDQRLLGRGGNGQHKSRDQANCKPPYALNHGLLLQGIVILP